MSKQENLDLLTKRIESMAETIRQHAFQAQIDHINEEILDLKAKEVSVKKVSDGYHTFDELYYHRMILFSIVCNLHPHLAWKSKQHSDGTMFDGDFIVGIKTPQGHYTYHYNLKYWDMFNVLILDKAPEWDGHKPKDIVRLLSLIDEKKENDER